MVMPLLLGSLCHAEFLISTTTDLGVFFPNPVKFLVLPTQYTACKPKGKSFKVNGLNWGSHRHRHPVRVAYRERLINVV